MSATTNTSMRARATPALQESGPASVSSRTRRSAQGFFRDDERVSSRDEKKTIYIKRVLAFDGVSTGARTTKTVGRR